MNLLLINFVILWAGPQGGSERKTETEVKVVVMLVVAAVIPVWPE